jgi:hypothetical protein
MKKFAAISATVLALVGAGAAATPSFARDYGYGYRAADEACHDKKQDKGATGAIVGGLAGALLGSQIAGRGDHAGGAVIGGLAGAVLGNTIGRSSAKSSAACEARDYGRVDYRGRQSYYADYQRSHYRPYRYNGYAPYAY